MPPAVELDRPALAARWIRGLWSTVMTSSTGAAALLGGPDALPALVRSALEDDDPLMLLTLSSSVMAVVDPRVAELDEDLDAMALPSLEELVEMLLGIEMVEPQVLALTIGHLSGDPELMQHITDALPADLPGPAWLRRLGQVQPVRAARSVEPLGDVENVVVEMAGPDGSPWCMVTHIDHSLGAAVTDSVPVPFGLDDYEQHVRTSPEGALLTTVPLDLAAARAGLEAGLGPDEPLWTSTEPDLWPSSLPLLEYLIAQLPAGGTAWGVDAQDVHELADELLFAFVESPHWAWSAADPQWQCVQLLLLLHEEEISHGVDRVSPATVEAVMTDLWHTSFLGMEDAIRDALPEVLRAWTRFVLGRREVPAELTEQTVATIDELEPEFRRLTAGGDPLALSSSDLLLAGLSQLFGGLSRRPRPPLSTATTTDPGVLAGLDAAPLPDEDRRISAWPDWMVEIIENVLDLAEPVIEQIGGVEARTALRRTIARLLEVSPDLIIGGRDPRRTAGALVVIVGSVNNLVGVPGGTPIAHVMRSLSLSTPLNDRVRTLLAALGWRDRTQARDVILHPDLLTGARRTELVDGR